MNGSTQLTAAEVILNPKLNLQIIKVGVEQTPVMVIDDFLQDVQPLIDDVAHTDAFADGQRTAYPGVRCSLPDTYIEKVLEFVRPKICSVYGMSSDIKPLGYYGLYSLVTTPEKELKTLQRVPHCDSRKPFYFAILHYLNPAPHGGTGFYRHNPSGYERINDERFHHYVMTAEAFMAQNGLPAARYYQADDGHFTLVDSVAYKPNRLLVYPGNLLHSGLIEAQRDICADPVQGRLTANIFVAFD